MKKIYLMKWMLPLFVLCACYACKETTKTAKTAKEKNTLSALGGSLHEILVILDTERWNGNVGDTIKQWFKQQQLGLPQPEPMFDLLCLPAASFKGNIMSYRNILHIRISPQVQKPVIGFKDSPWAKTQKMFQIEAASEADFFEVFNANKERMTSVFLKAERDRFVALYRREPNLGVQKMFHDKYNVGLSIPHDYVKNKEAKDFVWASRETKVDSRGFVFFQRPYSGSAQLEHKSIVDSLNVVLAAHIPGPLDKSYMGIDTIAPVIAENFMYASDCPAITMKGLWMVVNDFMGGPFVLNVVHDTARNRVLYLMGYVYAPDDTKRNMIRQVEAILYTLKFE